MAYALKVQAELNNLRVVDVAPDGDCFFHSVRLQLSALGVQKYLTGADIRRDLVYFLLNDVNRNLYADRYKESYGRSFKTYLQKVINGAWANHFTIAATATMLQITIRILNQRGQWTVIDPLFGEGRREIIIGHIFEIHYVSLDKKHWPVREFTSKPPNMFDDSEFPPLRETLSRPTSKKRPMISTEPQKWSTVHKRVCQKLPERADIFSNGTQVSQNQRNQSSIPPTVNSNSPPADVEKILISSTEREPIKRVEKTIPVDNVENEEEIKLDRERDQIKSIHKRLPDRADVFKKGPEVSSNIRNQSYTTDIVNSNSSVADTEIRIISLAERKCTNIIEKTVKDRKQGGAPNPSKIVNTEDKSQSLRKLQREQSRIRIAATMAMENEEEINQRNEKERNKKRIMLATENEEEANQRRERDRIRKKIKRAAENEEEGNQRRESNRIRYRAWMAAKTDQERDHRWEQVRQHRAATAEKRREATHKIATMTPEILQGTYHVPNLSDTKEGIGNMDQICNHCGAYKFKGESFTICCGGGKIKLSPFPKPPQEIYDLWIKDTPEARLFRANSRSLNNAACLSSLAVQEKKC